MKTLTQAACLAMLAVGVARGNAVDIGDYDVSTGQAPNDQDVPDYSDADVSEMPEMAVPPTAPAPSPTDAMAPGPAPMPMADDPAGPPMDVDDMWEECLTKLGQDANATHSLQELVTGPFEQRNGGPSVFLNILPKVDDEVLELLTEFDLSGLGYTLILPFNQARDFDSSQPEAKAPVFEVYDFDPNTTTTMEVSEVFRAHIIPGTLTYNGITAEIEGSATGEYTVESLQGYEWTFALASGNKLVGAGNASASSNATAPGAGGSYPVIIDNHNITDRGFFNIEPDIRNVAECPNAVIASTDGFFAAPQYLEAPAEAPAPAPAPTPAPAPAPADTPAPSPADDAVEPVPATDETSPADDGGNDAGSAVGVVGGGVVTAAAAGAAALLLALV